MPETRKEGKNVYCSLSVPEIKQACHLVHYVFRSQIRNAQKLPIQALSVSTWKLAEPAHTDTKCSRIGSCRKLRTPFVRIDEGRNLIGRFGEHYERT